MAAVTFQEVIKAEGSVQRRWIEKQTRGHQVLHGFGSPNRATEKEYEVLPDGPRTTKYDLGLPMVRGDATKHRLGQRMARLHSIASGSPNVECPQSTVRIPNQKPPTPHKDKRASDSSRLCLVPRETPNDGIKIG